jgi:hypothetical protein
MNFFELDWSKPMAQDFRKSMEAEMEKQQNRLNNKLRKAFRECHMELPPEDYPDFDEFMVKFRECVNRKLKEMLV